MAGGRGFSLLEGGSGELACGEEQPSVEPQRQRQAHVSTAMTELRDGHTSGPGPRMFPSGKAGAPLPQRAIGPPNEPCEGSPPRSSLPIPTPGLPGLLRLRAPRPMSVDVTASESACTVLAAQPWPCFLARNLTANARH